MIEIGEDVVSGRDEIFTRWQVVVRHRDSAYEFGHDFRSVRLRKRLEVLEQFSGPFGNDSESVSSTRDVNRLDVVRRPQKFSAVPRHDNGHRRFRRS
jgi:hypothetical protein